MKLPSRIAVIASAAVFFAWTGCAQRGPSLASGLKQVPGRECQEPEELLDVLTRFSDAVSHRKYHEAVSLLVQEEQAKIIGADGSISDEMKRKMNALNVSSLANHPKIDLVRGRLKGIFDCLPCLDEADSATVAAASKPEPDTAAQENPDERKRREAAALFYGNIRSENWLAAADLAHPEEWKVFLDEKGNLKSVHKARLLGIQECDLEALLLKDERLTGIVLLLEPPASNLWLKSRKFFDLIQANEIDKALELMVESERRFFRDEAKGGLRADRVAKLKEFDRSQWRRLYLSHELLLGVVDAAIGFHNL